MTFEALLTLFGLVAAVYTLLPIERRLELGLRLHRLDWGILLAGILLVHYIFFFPILESLGLAPNLGPWRYGFTPPSASYLILVTSVALVVLRARKPRLSPNKIDQFRSLSE